jgi:hypothetical protein
MKVRLTFTEELLGTASADPEIHREYIASKSPEAKTIEEEVAAVGVEGVFDKGKSVFPRHEGKPFLYDYQLKGFFKDSCSALARVKSTKSSEIKAFKKVIDGLIFVFPRRIYLQMPGEVGECSRPLRAQTAQGERVALATSESAPIGTTIEFEVNCLEPKLEDVLTEWLDYGRLRGLGQWRNSGKGRFNWAKA